MEATQPRFLTDPYLDPPETGSNSHYTEKSVRIPSYWCYRPPATSPAVTPLPALANGYGTSPSWLWRCFHCARSFVPAMTFAGTSTIAISAALVSTAATNRRLRTSGSITNATAAAPNSGVP